MRLDALSPGEVLTDVDPVAERSDEPGLKKTREITEIWLQSRDETLDVFLFRAGVRQPYVIWGFKHVVGFRRRHVGRSIQDASGEYSLKALTKKAAAVGLTNRTGGTPLVKAKIHQLLQNPIDYGEFYWLGQLHQGLHKPIISRDLFARVQDVFAAANHPRHTKRQHAFAGLVTCGRCGCAFTAETKKEQYVYYHCTGHRGPCGNSYPNLSRSTPSVSSRIAGDVRR